jgi:sorting nexin-25
MPNFERKLTEPITQSHKTSVGDTELSSSTSSLPATPPMPRRSTHLDFLISDNEKREFTPETRSRLFDDDADEALNEEDEDDFIQVERMEAIQAALNEIIASADIAGKRIAPSRQSSGSVPAESMASSMILPTRVSEPTSTKLVSRSFEDIRKHASARPVISAPQSRIPSSSKAGPSLVHRNSMSKLVEKTDNTIFSEDVPEDDVGVDATGDPVDPQDVVVAAPGNLNLSVEVNRLQGKIQDLVKQEHLLDTLTRQAELTGNAVELKILHRSLNSVRREQRTTIFQKAQFEQQEEENRLIPARTRLSVPSASVNIEEGEGKQVVRYTVEVKQMSEDGSGILSGWIVGRRYNEFWEMDKALREWIASSGSRVLSTISDLPPKKLGINLSSGFVESRRIGLERYLQVSDALCDAI